MSVSRRDRLLGVYAYSDTGTDGVPVDTWTLTAAWWGRIDDKRGMQRTVGGSPDVQIDSVIQFADEAIIPANCVIVDGGSFNASAAYHVRSVFQKRLSRVQLAYADRIDKNRVDATAFLLNGVYILDGSQLLSGVVQ